MDRPQADEYNAFYKGYIDAVSDDVIQELESQATELPAFLKELPAEKADYAYAPKKWKLKELFGHMIDTERIMAYRLLRISRNDSTPLPGFEENHFVVNSTFKEREFASLIEEFEVLRKANLYLIHSLNEEQLLRRGTASNSPVTAKALLFIMAGHVKHHWKIIRERYL